MTISFRHYQYPDDYQRISKFLIAHHQPGNADGNWLEPAWEYMHGHPYLDRLSLGKIGMWEDNGKLAAVTHYESVLGEAFCEFDPGYRYLMADMLDFAEKYLPGVTDNGKKRLQVFVNDYDEEFKSLVIARGYEKDKDGTRPMYQFAIPDPFPVITLPAGFRLTSLAEECNWTKLHRVIWRGFNHQGEPPMSDEELESRQVMFDTPTARRDLKIAVAAPNGDFVSFCGMWFEPNGKFAYIEPVATDPDFRRLGLAKAAVLEGVRRCGLLGAAVAYVGSDQEFYQALGFRKIYHSECWVKYLA